MSQNEIKRDTTTSDLSKHAQELNHALSEIEKLRQEVSLHMQERRSAEERVTKLQNLLDLMTHNFPGGRICVFTRETKNDIADPSSQIGLTLLSTEEHGMLRFDKETAAKVGRAFDGERVFCEMNFGGKFYHVTAVPLSDSVHDVSHNVNEVLCVVQDLTERKTLEEGLVKALKKEKELGELKSRFVTMASHEFRTPLTMILSSIFLIENASGENYETEKMVHTSRIKRAVNNLTLILNEFLSLEKLEQNKVEVVCSDVNVPEFIQDTLSEMEIIKREKQIIDYHHSGEQWIARIDHHLLWSIVTNLVSNAIKYSKTGDTIKITSEIGQRSIVLMVTDTGIGIPDDEQQFIFGRFFRARNATNIEGTGLGLHIIQKYIHLLKGTVTFESQLDVGTTFTVVLPDAGVQTTTMIESDKISDTKSPIKL